MNREQILELCMQTNLEESDKIVLQHTINELYCTIDEQQTRIDQLEGDVEDLQDSLDELDDMSLQPSVLQEVCKQIVKEHVYDWSYKQYNTIPLIIDKLQNTLFYECGDRV